MEDAAQSVEKQETILMDSRPRSRQIFRTP
jgi:hypothetical protein